MKIIQKKIAISTRGFNEIIDITGRLHQIVSESGLKHGNILIFVSGSTAGVTTIEYEPGLLQDIPETFERIAPMNARYHHDDTWHDGNGYAHIRAALLGPSIMIPFENGKMALGTWQQVVLIDFDNRTRKRNLHVQLSGTDD